MRVPTPIVLLVGVAVSAGDARGSERVIRSIGPQAARERIAGACVTPGSPACQKAYADAAPEAAAAIIRLAQRRHPRAGDTARRAADSGFVELRVAAATALGELWSEAPQTAVLAELLDDPVPAVRTAARRALRGAGDDRARLLMRRVDAFSVHDADGDLAPDMPVAPASLGVPLPADALYLYFASEPAAGRSVFVTGESAAAVGARLAKAGKGPYSPEEFREAIAGKMMEGMGDSPGEMQDENGVPSPEAMEKAMEMAQRVMSQMAEHPDASPEEQSKYLAKAAGHRLVDESLGDKYSEAEIFGGAKLFVVELPNADDVAVVVYRDQALGRTEIAVHRQP